MGLKASGFASPAQGYEEHFIDLNKILVRNPPATFFYRMESGEMAGMGLEKGALLVVDRSIEPGLNSIALIRHEGRFLCRVLGKHEGLPVFTNGLNNITPILDDTEIIGTVTASIQIYDISH